jgi:hypothetical protein
MTFCFFLDQLVLSERKGERARFDLTAWILFKKKTNNSVLFQIRKRSFSFRISSKLARNLILITKKKLKKKQQQQQQLIVE